MKHTLSRIAKFLTRPQQETAQLGDWSSTISKLLLMGAILGTVLGLLVPFLSEEVGRWEHGQPTLTFPLSRWKSVYEEQDQVLACAGQNSTQTSMDIRCLAHPQNQTLWHSETTRADSGHFSRVKESKNGTYWLGLELTKEEIQKAKSFEAYQFILNRIPGFYKVWVQGELIKSSQGTSTSVPVIIDLPPAKFSASSVKIVLEFVYETGQPFPDLFFGTANEGLATSRQVRDVVSRVVFWQSTGPSLFFALNFVIGILFFLFWLWSPKKQEYAYLGIFALSGALVHMFSIGLVVDKLSYTFHSHTHASLKFFHGAFAFFLGLAFARTRRGLFRWGIPAILGLPWTVGWLLPNSLMIFLGSLGPALGAAICWIQASWLSQERKNLSIIPVRLRRLVFFGMGLSALAISYGIWGHEEITRHVFEFIISLFLCGIMVKEYREAERLSRTAPISEYHRLSVLPTSLKGIVATIVVRGSESLQLHSEKRGDPTKLLQICASHFTTAVMASGGVLMKVQGDRISAFFANGDSMDMACRALHRFVSEIPVLENSFLDQGLLSTHIGLGFHASFIYGTIQPVWEEFASTRIAGWKPVEPLRLLEELNVLVQTQLEHEEEQKNINSLYLSEDLKAKFENVWKNLTDKSWRWENHSKAIPGVAQKICGAVLETATKQTASNKAA